MNKKYMELAFECAKEAFKLDEVPIGAVIVKDDEVVSMGYNQKEKNCSVLEHAELLAIREAEKKLDNWRLDDCDIYVTLDPCPMCASAIKQARIRYVYSALENSDLNNSKILDFIFKTDRVNPEVKLITNLACEPSQKILNSFFKKKRIK